ncbi:hypothetical protein RSK20926_08477 [Roseobacter sp. SK209-2-6]|uniref:DUF1810 domain-containing protein n=1 Tax=Roseobacter sp. SK209-2-6 TaxID=388739 RepID=UPI0000F3D0F8|nr:DUF1810 domain-containing protein [Roseobacter sp. SK209-2-6]EBA16991.1 hypothetical protein RSK20926_08477 [Roseobacter sp. SK209-2-6]
MTDQEDDLFEDDFAEELEMFVEAQDTVWPEVLSELKAGKKTGHWMWFVFPQLAELGQSHMAQLYGIEDLSEAKAYLEHEVLRARLIEVSELVLSHQDKTAMEILGQTDAKKLCSSMTLFAAVPGAPDVFATILATFYAAEPCDVTLQSVS